MENIFTIIGLALNIICTVVLALPFLQIKRDLEDDLLIDGKKETTHSKEKTWYTRKGFLKDRNITLMGLGLLLIGFALQLVVIVPPLVKNSSRIYSRKLHLEDYMNLSNIEFKWMGDKLYWSGDINSTYDKSISLVSVKVDFYKETETGSPFDTKYLAINNVPPNKTSHFQTLVFSPETLKTGFVRFNANIYKVDNQELLLNNNSYTIDLGGK